MRQEKYEELREAIEEMKTIKKVLLEEPHNFITIKKFQCLLNNNHLIKREQIIKRGNNGSAVIILPITKEGNTIITIQPRVFTKSTIGIGLPAGYVEENESYLIATKRELKEETGYEAEEYIDLCSYYQDDGCSAAFNKGYLGLNCKKTSSQHLDSSEYIKYMECTYEELLELVEKGYIQEGGSQLLIERSKKYILK